MLKIKPTTKIWLLGRVPVIAFGLTAAIWTGWAAHSMVTRPPYPTYPDLVGIMTVILWTLSSGLLGFGLSAYGLCCAVVPKRWAWAGLILNAPVSLYMILYYPVAFIYR